MKDFIKCTNCGASYNFIANSWCPHCKPKTDLDATLELIKLQKQQLKIVEDKTYD